MTDTTEPQPPTSGPEWERPMTMDHVTYTWPDVPPTATDHVTGARVHGLIDHQLDRLAATLFNSIDKLEQHIEQRAHEIAEPRVTDIEETAAERVALAHDERDQWRERFTDLQREHERQRAALERRAERTEAANTRVRAAHPEHEGRCARCVQWCNCMDQARANDPELRDLEDLGLRWTECPHGNEPYPCPTIRALDGQEPGRG